MATGGIAENWVYGGNPTCAPCAANPTQACTACTVRYGVTFSYSVPVTPGHTYIVRFTFSEVYWTTAQSRLFNVLINTQTVLTGIDPYSLAGGVRWVPVTRQVTYTAPAGSTVLTVTLQATKDNAILAALEVSQRAPMQWTWAF